MTGKTGSSGLKIGNTEIGAEARVVGVIYGGEDAKLAQAAQDNGADLIELRLDLYPTLRKEAVAKIVRRVKEACRLPIIATCRTKAEGGSYQGDEDERRWLFSTALPLVDAIDIELSATAIISQVIAEAKTWQKAVIVSHHNFSYTPPEAELEAIVKSAKQAGADIVKLATMAHSLDDAARLLVFTYTSPHKPLVSISMGQVGAASRFIAPLFGSCLTYAHLSGSTAPGQLSLYELQRRLRLIFPADTRP